MRFAFAAPLERREGCDITNYVAPGIPIDNAFEDSSSGSSGSGSGSDSNGSGSTPGGETFYRITDSLNIRATDTGDRRIHDVID